MGMEKITVWLIFSIQDLNRDSVDCTQKTDHFLFQF